LINEIIVDAGKEETRIALMEDGELVELYIENSRSERLVGNIYRGKVCSVLPGMQAAFVDIGFEKNAFLYVSDAMPNFEDLSDEDEHSCDGCPDMSINEILKPGQEITVQVVKEPFGTKGPRVTTHITLPGKYLVLLPNANYVGVSRRIVDEDERNRLRKTADAIKPEDMGVIVRTAAEGKSEKDFLNDIDFLTSLWKSIKKKEKKGNVPRCIYKDLNLVQRTARDLFTWNIDRFVINNSEVYTELIELVDSISPSLKSRIEYFSKDYEIFEYYNIEPAIARALSRKVWLKCGGYLIIDRTEALTVIDVNTGKYVGSNNLEDTVLRTNIDAAREIAKQIRLRDIGGIIIIDFIDMNELEHQNMVLDELKQALQKDRTKTSVVGMTGLGLIEMTRKKVRQELSSLVSVECPHCEGTGKMMSPEVLADIAQMEISMYFSQNPVSAIKVKAHPTLASLLKRDENGNLARMQMIHKKKIVIEVCSSIKYGELDIEEIDINSLVC
jgi:ribonuclease G